MRGFDERTRDVLERSVDGKKDKGRVDVREHEDDGERAVEQSGQRLVCDVEILQEAVQHTVCTKDGFPRVTADEIADPQWDDHELVEKFFARAGVEGEEIRERKAEKERKNCDRSRDAHGAEKDRGVQRIFEELGILVEIPVVDDYAVLGEPKGVGEHQGVRDEKEEHDPKERRERDGEFVEAGVHD